VIGGDIWWRFVRRRRDLDDGSLTLLVSLRRLPEDEALLAVDWGTAFANALLLIQPSAAVDLTDSWLNQPPKHDAWLREQYGSWQYWHLAPEGKREPRSELLDLSSGVSIVAAMKALLPQVYPPGIFRASLMALNAREADLFIGKPVERVVIPFLTRLGLPIPYDPAILLDAMRDLINLGQAWVEDPEDGRKAYHGPERPLPGEVSNQRLREMMRI